MLYLVDLCAGIVSCIGIHSLINPSKKSVDRDQPITAVVDETDPQRRGENRNEMF